MTASATPISAAALTALLATGLYQFPNQTPVLISSGVALSAAAPLVFLVWHHRFATTGKRSHPVLVSIISGFGCIMALVGVHRFGDRYQWLLVCALVALCIWMLWQRYVWRRNDSG